MIKRIVVSLLATLMLTACARLAAAQQSGKVARIGYLAGTGSDAQSARIEAFRQGLRDLGYVEGKNVVIGVSR
jgi:putative ABC transport system substrate-binding protein